MADDDSQLVVQIVLDDGSVRQGFIRVQNEAKSSFGSIAEMAAGVFGGNLLTSAFESVKSGIEHLFTEAINQAREAEKAVQGLNVALGVSGRYSAEASAGFQELADQIQATTTVSDDQVLGLEKLATTYAKTNAQAMELTKTSVNLAAVTGQDANTALMQLSGTLSGSAGRLARLYPALQQFTSAQLKAGAAVDYFNSRFDGAAAAQVNTFDGRLSQLKNNFDDFLKSIGKIVTSSPALISVITFVSKEFASLAASIKAFSANSGDVFKTPIEYMILFGRGLVMYVMAPLEAVYNVFKFVFESIVTGFQGIITGMVTVASKVITYFRPDSELAKTVGAFADSTQAVFVDMANNTADAFNNMATDFTASSAVDSMLEKLQQTVEASQAVKTAYASLGDGSNELAGHITSLAQTWDLMLQGAKDGLVELEKTGTKVFSELGGNAIKGLANGVSAGMAAIGKALVQGKDIFGAFAGAMLSALGQAAIQMGATYILFGLARLFASYGADATGYQLIGIGSALGIAGGAMMAIGQQGSAGGGAGGDTSVGSGGGAGVSSVGGTADTQAGLPETKLIDKGGVVVNIHGDVLDSGETGLRIVELINGAYNSQGAKIQAQT